MRTKLITIAGGLAGVTALVSAAVLSAPTAQAVPPHAAADTGHSAESTIHSGTNAVSPARHWPAYTANVTLTVRCGKFVGQIGHGGIGGQLDPAYLAVRGELSSSCNSTTSLQMRWDAGSREIPGTIIARAGARGTVNVAWQVASRSGEYAHIGGRAGSTIEKPPGSTLWGRWKHV